MLRPKIARFVTVLLVLALGMNALANADMAIISRDIPKAQKVGEGRLHFLFWSVYDASLYAPDGQYNARQPFALHVAYLLDASGAEITARSVDEMRKLGATDAQLEAWEPQMARIFPNVAPGVTITGLRDAKGYSHFYRNDVAIGSINDPEFTARFFGKWLDQNSPQPRLRRQLLGLTR